MADYFTFNGTRAPIEPWNRNAPPHNADNGTIYSIILSELEAQALVEGVVPTRIKQLLQECLQWRLNDPATWTATTSNALPATTPAASVKTATTPMANASARTDPS